MKDEEENVCLKATYEKDDNKVTSLTYKLMFKLSVKRSKEIYKLESVYQATLNTRRMEEDALCYLKSRLILKISFLKIIYDIATKIKSRRR